MKRRGKEDEWVENRERERIENGNVVRERERESQTRARDLATFIDDKKHAIALIRLILTFEIENRLEEEAGPERREKQKGEPDGGDRG